MELYSIIPSSHFISGGNIYNQQIFKHLGREHQIHFFNELDSISLSKIREFSKQIILVDSLYIPELYGKIPELFTQNTIVGIVHLPVSLNPMFDKKEMLELEKLAYQECNSLICTSQVMKNQLVNSFSIPENQILVIQPGVLPVKPKKEFAPIPTKMICLSNLIQGKGLEMLLATCKKIKTDNWSLEIYGDQNMDPIFVNYLKEFVRIHTMNNNIFFKHSIPQKDLLLNLSSYDLLICASSFESYGMAVSEAIHASLPYLSTKVGAHEKFEASGIGVYCEVGSPEEFFHKLQELLSGGQLYQDLCDRAREGKFTLKSWEESANSFDQHLRSLL